MQQTVNYLLAMEKSLRERLAQLKALENEVTKTTFWNLGSDKEKREEPTYDIKLVDKKILGINKALFEINHKIKESNARTLVDVTFDYDNLISPIE